jgi:hypothetical protein
VNARDKLIAAFMDPEVMEGLTHGIWLSREERLAAYEKTVTQLLDRLFFDMETHKFQLLVCRVAEGHSAVKEQG